MGEFLKAHEAIAAPIIEWGGTIFLIALILSPFAVIAHRRFRPTRWWHVVGAYGVSFALLVGTELFLTHFDQWLIHTYFNSVDLYSAYSDATFNPHPFLLFTYPLLVFYSTRLLRGSFNTERFIRASLLAFGLFILLLFLILQYTLYGLGKISQVL
jgi:hypothetical protein